MPTTVFQSKKQTEQSCTENTKWSRKLQKNRQRRFYGKLPRVLPATTLTPMRLTQKPPTTVFRGCRHMSDAPPSADSCGECRKNANGSFWGACHASDSICLAMLVAVFKHYSIHAALYEFNTSKYCFYACNTVFSSLVKTTNGVFSLSYIHVIFYVMPYLCT